MIAWKQHDRCVLKFILFFTRNPEQKYNMLWKDYQYHFNRLLLLLDQLHTADQKVSNALVEKNKLVSEMRVSTCYQ